MNSKERQLVQAVGGDPTSDDWFWFMCRGAWGPSRDAPRGFVGLELLRRVVRERTENDAEAPLRLQAIGRAALGSSDAGMVRRAVQILAVVGDDEDLARLGELSTVASDERVASDARAAVFELRRSLEACSEGWSP